jgi:hypothetical protein
MAGQVQETLRGAASDVASRVGDTMESTRQSRREGTQWAGDRAGELWSNLSAMVRRNPVGAVAVAFGAGCLVTACLAAWSSSPYDDTSRRMSRSSM